MKRFHKHKKIIAVPRLKEYGELIDDHQKELAIALAEKNYMFYLDDLSQMTDAIIRIRDHKFDAYTCESDAIADVIDDYLETNVRKT